MGRDRRTTLFVAGFGRHLRARDLAYEFERYGRLVRCDIPAPRSSTATPYAFIEFEDPRDAEDAYYEMGDRKIDGDRLTIQWAKSTIPDRRRHRSRSPPRNRRRSRTRSRSRSRSRSRTRSISRDRDARKDGGDSGNVSTVPPLDGGERRGRSLSRERERRERSVSQ